MPLYEYQCKKCSHRFERIQRFSDPLVKKCPKCGGKVEQVLSAPAVQFKGTGWYVTDYRSKGAGGLAAQAPARSAKSEAGKDSKAAAKETKSEAPAKKAEKKYP
jgi:putative FmdB family regulatory protein